MHTPTDHSPSPRRRVGRSLVAVVAAVSTLGAVSAGAPVEVTAAESALAPADADARSIAEFEGRRIDLSKDWEGAQACWVDESGSARCFASEAELDEAIAADEPPTDAAKPGDESPANARAASCSTSLRLYRDSYFAGPLLYVSQRYTWVNLSWYGFDNVVSSYRVGACSATFRSGSNGSGSTYGGSTGAWSAASVMGSWSDVLSSVYLV